MTLSQFAQYNQKSFNQIGIKSYDKGHAVSTKEKLWLPLAQNG